MVSETIEARLSTLEREMSQVKRLLENASQPGEPWWERIAGAFEDDPAFEEAMRLGRQYRESLRPRKDAPRGRRDCSSRHRSS